MPLAASVLAGRTSSPIHPVLLKSRTYPRPILLPVKVCCDGITIDIKGCHIPQAPVRLLSPQALYKSIGGHGEQDLSKYSLILSDGITLEAPYGCANLPVLPMCSHNHPPSCFWSRCFSFHASEQDVWARSILAASNQNLTLAQKEFLL